MSHVTTGKYCVTNKHTEVSKVHAGGILIMQIYVGKEQLQTFSISLEEDRLGL